MRGALFKIFSFFVLAAALSACSKFGRLPKDGFTHVTFAGQNSASNFASAPRTGTVPGGVVVWAVSDTKTYSFILPSEAATYSETFQNGDWTFYAARWDGGTNQLEGTLRCGMVDTTFTGSAVNLNIAVSQDCTDPFFGDPAFLTGVGLPRPLHLFSCLGEPNSVTGDSNCAADVGDLHSFKLVIGAQPAFLPEGSGISPTHKLTSGCKNLTGTAEANTGLQIPVGEGASSPIYTEVHAFDGPSCTGNEFIYYYSHGFAHGEDSSGEATAYAGTSNNVTAIFFAHGFIPAPTYISADISQGGWGGGYKITITGTGFRKDPQQPDVTIGGHTCMSPVITSSTSLYCTVGHVTALNEIGGPSDLEITNEDGQFVTATGAFQYIDDGMGTGWDETVTLNASVTDTSTESLPSGKIYSASRNVQDITVSGSNSTFTLNGGNISSLEFEVDDEVMWHVSAASSDTDCIGGTLERGSFGSARITAISGNSITVNGTLPNTAGGTPYSPINANIASSSRLNTDSPFCVIQLVRVPNLSNLYFNVAGGSEISVEPPPFDFSTGKGGFLPLRISNTYTVDGTLWGAVSAYAKGFAGGAPGFQGDSRQGQGQASSSAADSAGRANISAGGGGGGGAHEGVGGNGGNGSNGAASTGSSCFPTNGCAGFGAGGGGSDTASGGRGGGAVLLYARNLYRTSGMNMAVKSGGEAGGNSAGGGGGGGAGGTSFVQTLGTSTILMSLDAGGGSGGTGTPVGGGGGGGGGAGQARRCSATAFNGLSFANGYGVGGSGASAGVTGGDGYTTANFTNRETTISAGTEFCP